MSQPSEIETFVTVVSVGTEELKNEQHKDGTTNDNNNSSGYVTVLTIGDSENDSGKEVIEEVLVYRLPGERLGFGLKFEGGTKASEFVKRLFIQSCAPDSPASRVKSSWGTLTEGDEVLEIDSISVNSMTRIDCVRCLKDSNVVIKLLVRHFVDSESRKTRSIEDLPLVISAEKKRTPPPPPPVPPRKIPRKLLKHSVPVTTNGTKETNENQENPPPVPLSRHSLETNGSTNNKVKKFQSPRSSGRSSYSPDIPRRDRRFSDGSLGPPDAQVYVDLFSQESTQSLSESDDTGSTISTVIDRFSSFPTTTTSSFAGSLPSTPTSVQKHLDLSNILNYDDDDIIPTNKNIINPPKLEETDKTVQVPPSNEDGSPLQPPSCFQDAPLSYGNEDMRIVEPDTVIKKEDNIECKTSKKPPVPPRSRDILNNVNNTDIKELKTVHDENMNIPSLPRLVDFVPKINGTKDIENPIEVMKLFLENERHCTMDCDIDETDNLDVYSNGMDLYSSKWSLSPQLATIGEVEEEGGQEFQFNRSVVKSTPIVIVENADCENDNNISHPTEERKNYATNEDPPNMETPPSDSRQPPDGHEFPDLEVPCESPIRKMISKPYQVPYKPTETERDSVKTYRSVENININSQSNSSLNEFSSVPKTSLNALNKNSSVSNNDLSSIINNRPNHYESNDDLKFKNSLSENKTTLHTRSQSLIDMSSLSRQKNDKWNQMVEQRKRGLSKLKGLVIPEHISENEVAAPIISLPEIKSQNNFVPITHLVNEKQPTTYSNHTDSAKPTLISPPWTNNNTSSTLPKYSPAFKRKSLNVYTSNPVSNNIKKIESNTFIMNEKVSTPNTNFIKQTKVDVDDFRLENLSDPPKSLESITSPTRSDCSFDYITSTKKSPKTDNHSRINKESHTITRLNKDLGKSEDESDNDSAVSSSQSSYMSRCSPPPSPTRSCEITDYDNSKSEDDEKCNNHQCRLLKPSSVEAINRKNILASAKCRSGRDLKVGSPVIHRKYEENDNVVGVKPEVPVVNSIKQEVILDKFVEVEQIAKEIEVTTQQQQKENVNESPPISNGIAPTPPKTPEIEKLNLLTPAATPKNTFVPITTSSTNPKSSNVRLHTESSRVNRDLYGTSDIRSMSSLYKKPQPLSVNALRKNFENFGSTPPSPPKVHTIKPQVNKRNVKLEIEKTEMKITNEKKTLTPPPKKVTEEEKSFVKAVVPRRSSLVQKENSTEKSPTSVIKLNLDKTGGSLGITLAGGTDYESKDITVHRIRYGSVAYQNGRLKRGDKLISVNGKSTKGLTHDEAVDLLKEQVTEFLIVIEESKEEVPSPSSSNRRSSTISNHSEPKSPVKKTLEKKANHVISIVKDGSGLGFSIEGGKDSPNGDVPLLIKKIFQGGAADKCGKLLVGDELIAINDTNITSLSRIEAWNLMKKLPDGDVNVHIFR